MLLFSTGYIFYVDVNFLLFYYTYDKVHFFISNLGHVLALKVAYILKAF